MGKRQEDAVDQAVEVLNRIHTADPSVLPALISHRVPCNEALADDPTVQVGATDLVNPDLRFEVGLLGIINGLFGADERGWGFIAAVYDEHGGPLTHFERLRPRSGEVAGS